MTAEATAAGFVIAYFDPDGRCVGRNPQKRSSPIDLLAIDVVEHRVVGRRVEVLL